MEIVHSSDSFSAVCPLPPSVMNLCHSAPVHPHLPSKLVSSHCGVVAPVVTFTSKGFSRVIPPLLCVFVFWRTCVWQADVYICTCVFTGSLNLGFLDSVA